MRAHTSAVRLLVFTIALGATACSGGESALKKQVGGLQDELTRLQNSHDQLEDRMAALEIAASQAAHRGAEKAEENERPPLKVVRLEPGAPAPAPAPAAQPAASPTSHGASDAEIDAEDRPLLTARGDEEGSIQSSKAEKAPARPVAKWRPVSHNKASGTRAVPPAKP